MADIPAPCPWDALEPAAMHFCERELCGWITQPANTWSNLAYIIVGAWLIRLAFREGHRPLAAIGLIEILIGIGSFFFHMSSTHFCANTTKPTETTESMLADMSTGHIGGPSSSAA